LAFSCIFKKQSLCHSTVFSNIKTLKAFQIDGLYCKGLICRKMFVLATYLSNELDNPRLIYQSIFPVGAILSMGSRPVCLRNSFLSHDSDVISDSQYILTHAFSSTPASFLKFIKKPHFSKSSHLARTVATPFIIAATLSSKIIIGIACYNLIDEGVG
jgi:hypothetical protein